MDIESIRQLVIDNLDSKINKSIDKKIDGLTSSIIELSAVIHSQSAMEEGLAAAKVIKKNAAKKAVDPDEVPKKTAVKKTTVKKTTVKKTIDAKTSDEKTIDEKTIDEKTMDEKTMDESIVTETTPTKVVAKKVAKKVVKKVAEPDSTVVESDPIKKAIKKSTKKATKNAVDSTEEIITEATPVKTTEEIITEATPVKAVKKSIKKAVDPTEEIVATPVKAVKKSTKKAVEKVSDTIEESIVTETTPVKAVKKATKKSVKKVSDSDNPDTVESEATPVNIVKKSTKKVVDVNNDIGSGIVGSDQDVAVVKTATKTTTKKSVKKVSATKVVADQIDNLPNTKVVSKKGKKSNKTTKKSSDNVINNHSGFGTTIEYFNHSYCQSPDQVISNYKIPVDIVNASKSVVNENMPNIVGQEYDTQVASEIFLRIFQNVHLKEIRENIQMDFEKLLEYNIKNENLNATEELDDSKDEH